MQDGSYLVEIIEDSVAPSGVRLTTMKLCYPARIHWDVLMHRAFSRSVMSTRAVPWIRSSGKDKNQDKNQDKNRDKKTSEIGSEKPNQPKPRPGMRDWVLANLYKPLHWGANRAGMKPGEAVDDTTAQLAEESWDRAFKAVLAEADALNELGVHKSVVNTLLIPFMYLNVVITSCEDGWANFLNLRLHKDAAPEIQKISKMAAIEYRKATPKPLQVGQWHLPFVTEAERSGSLFGPDLAPISAARCARTSYETMDGTDPVFDADLKLFDTLAGSDPKHANPLEHAAEAAAVDCVSGNFRGWVQYRKTLPGEAATIKTFGPEQIDERLALYGDRDFLIA